MSASAFMDPIVDLQRQAAIPQRLLKSLHAFRVLRWESVSLAPTSPARKNLALSKRCPTSTYRGRGQLAERQGFEPWEDISPHWFSKPARSTAPAPLRNLRTILYSDVRRASSARARARMRGKLRGRAPRRPRQALPMLNRNSALVFVRRSRWSRRSTASNAFISARTLRSAQMRSSSSGCISSSSLRVPERLTSTAG